MNPPQNKYYYLENGLVVFTELYLKERGYCCKNGCRHCPFGYKKEGKEAGKVQSEESNSNSEK